MAIEMQINNTYEMASSSGADFIIDDTLSISPSILADGKYFSDLMQSSVDQKINRVGEVAQIAGGQSQSFNTYGDRFVAKLDAIGKEFKENMARAHEEINKPPGQLSLSDSLKFQYELAVVSLHIDVVSKGVQKAVQNIDTLVKMQ